MAISVTCSCSKQLRLKEIFAGKRVKCPACGKGLAVPVKGNGKPENGTPPREEESLFDFSTLMDDSPASAKAPAEPAPREDVTPPVKDDAKAAPTGKDEGQPAATDPGSVSPSPEKLPTPQVKRRLAAVLAGSFVVLAGLIVGLVLLIKNLDSSGSGTGDDPNGEYTGSGNKGPKLSAEEEERQRAQSQFRQQVTGGGNGNQAAVVAAKKKAEAKRKAKEDKLRREKQEEAKRVAAAKQKADKEKRKLEQIEAEKRKAAEAKRKAAEAEKQRLAQLEKQKRKQEKQKKETVAKLILEGNDALTAKDYDKAAKSLDQASKLAPDNEEIKRKLAKAQKELNKRQFARLLRSGKNYLKNKDYQKAVADLAAAQKLFPEDKEVIRALKQAQAGLDKLATAEAKKREAEARKKARAEADAYVKKGKKALNKKKYAEAHQQFSLAAKLFPNDPTIERLLKSAQAGLARQAERVRKQQEAEARVARQKAKKEADELVKKGKKALADKLYQEAVTSLSRAYQLAPNKTTLALLQKAEKALKEFQLAEAARRKEKEEADRAKLIRDLLAKAKLALNEKRLDEAEKLLLQARKLSPNDPDILGLLKQVQDAKKAIQDKAAKEQAEKLARIEAERKERHAKFEKKMTSGRKSLKAKKFDEAITHYKDALGVLQKVKDDAPLAARAEKAIKDAQDAKEKDRKLRLKLSR
jgi:tetratricopeptide (TPR) repeat protein